MHYRAFYGLKTPADSSRFELKSKAARQSRMHHDASNTATNSSNRVGSAMKFTMGLGQFPLALKPKPIPFRVLGRTDQTTEMLQPCYTRTF